jgi:hypothetical protein
MSVVLTFRWDPRKAAANNGKHGVTFDEAQSAFADEAALVIADPDHSDDEDRFVLLGLSNVARLLVVVHCLRDGGDTIRIISARKATRAESLAYTRRGEP